MYFILSGRPGGSVVKNLPASAGATRGVGLSHGSGKPLGEGNGNPLQYSCLGNPMDRGAWRATVHGVAKESFMTKQTNKKNQKPNNIASVYIRENKIKWRSHIHNHI